MAGRRDGAHAGIESRTAAALDYPMMADISLLLVHYSGRVQGVGFRYAVLQLAREFEVAGFVRNLPDGRVELEAEGRADELAAFAAAVAERMDGYIRRVEQSTRRRPPQHAGFQIR